MAAAHDDAPRGFGPRRGWRAAKAPRAAKGPPQRRSRPATPSADRPGSLAGPIARLLGLTPEEAARLVELELPAPGAPDATAAPSIAARALLADARQAVAVAEAAAETARRQRERDAERARVRVDRATQRTRRHEQKAAAEQGERQRLAGELERTQAQAAAGAAERDHLRRQLAAAGTVRPPDDADDDARTAGLRARIDALERQLEQRALLVEHLTERGAQAEAEAQRLLTSARNLRRLALEAGADDIDLVDPEDHAPLDADALPEVRTVLDAVRLAADHAEHLVYTERAFETARTAPYSEPRKLLRDLVALDRVAAAWAVTGGVGRPMRDIATEQQLDWADDVSDAARGQHPHEYQFGHAGRTLWAGPHVRVATGRGLQRTCRVYLALVKGGEADLAGLPRGVYVGPVGRHLSDSTSG